MPEKFVNHPLSIAQLLPCLESGGVERGTLEISQAAVQRGWNSWVISRQGSLIQKLQKQGGKHLDWEIGGKNPWTLRWIPSLIRFCRENRIDILHARSRMPAWLSFLAWRMMPAKSRPVFVTTVHGLNSVNPYSRIMIRGERVIVVSKTARDYVLHHYRGLDQSRLELIYRGVDESDFPIGFQPNSEWRARWYAEFPQLKGSRLMLLPGRISRRKGHSEFVDLVSRVQASQPDVIGMIVGGWGTKQSSYVDEIKSEIALKGLSNSVIWAGHRSDMREIYAVSDLVLSLSRKPESFGRTVLEALCMGVRCAGLDHGGVGEILSAMFPAGRLSIQGNESSWSETILDLLDPTAPRPLPNAYPLKKVLNHELDCYEVWAKSRCGRQVVDS